MGITVKDVLDLALAQVGYLEKASPKDEDSMLENAGSNNYTKFGRDLAQNVGSPYADGVAWCDMTVDWLFWKLGGKQAIIDQLYGLSAYTPTSAQYFKNNNAWYTGKSPKPGYQIFFKNSKRICHTGIVLKCENGTVYTIEGNTSSAKGVVANGGCVRQKSYPVTYAGIAGYGIPKCAANPSEINVPTASAVKKLQAKDIKEVQKFLNKNVMLGFIKAGIFTDKLDVDGIYGKMTRHAILAAWKQNMNAKHGTTLDTSNTLYGPACNAAANNCALVNGSEGEFVIVLQLLLKAFGFYAFDINGKLDDNTAKAVVEYQKYKGLIINPVSSVKAGQQVWYSLFN